MELPRSRFIFLPERDILFAQEREFLVRVFSRGNVRKRNVLEASLVSNREVVRDVDPGRNGPSGERDDLKSGESGLDELVDFEGSAPREVLDQLGSCIHQLVVLGT